jgi:hypothetical protein
MPEESTLETDLLHEEFVGPWSYVVRPVRIFLVNTSFSERSGPLEEPGRINEQQGIYVDWGVFRVSISRLILSLTVRVGEDAPFNLLITYAAEFEMDKDTPAEDHEETWKRVVGQTGPGLLYPYVREAVTDLTNRWRGEPFSLPLIPLPAIPMNKIEIPPPPLDSVDQTELRLQASQNEEAKNERQTPQKPGKRTRRRA